MASWRVGSVSAQAGEAAAWRRAAWQVAGGYFWYYGGIGVFVPFLALYLRELDFSGLQIGVLTALPSVGVAFAGPVIGAMSDTLGVHRWVLRIGLATALALAAGATMLERFPPLFLIMAGLAVALAAIPSMLDSYAVVASERAGRSYGAIRVWGSLGYMLAVLVIGRLMGDEVSSLVFAGYACCLGVALLAVAMLPRLGERRSQPALAGIADAVANRSLAMLLVVAFLIATGSALMNIYLGVHIEGIGGSASLIGLAFAISAASELPVIAFGGWFLARLGPYRLAVLAIVVYAVRFVAFSVITVPELVLGVQVFHGLSYGAFLIASVTLAHRLAPPGRAATAQALLTAMSFGFGAIVGSLVAGAFLDIIGTSGLFVAAAMLMAVTLIVLIAGNRLVGLDRSRPVR
jgi:MFS transporter, PPP family, 3-phenylpropionic acid transporter